MPVVTRGDLRVPTNPQFSQHVPTITTRMGQTSTFVPEKALSETPKVVWADRHPHPMELAARPDAEPLPSNPVEYQWSQDDERLNHCVVHCNHGHCIRLSGRSDARAEKFGHPKAYTCSCSASEANLVETKPTPEPAEKITPDTDVTPDEISALEHLDGNVDITIRLADAVQFQDTLYEYQVFDERELETCDAWKRHVRHLSQVAKLANVAGLKLVHEIEWYFDATLKALPMQCRSISPAALKKEITSVLGIALIEWRLGDWSLARRRPISWSPAHCMNTIRREEVARAIWQRYDSFVDELIKMFVLRDVRMKKQEELQNRAFHINSHSSDWPSDYVPPKDVKKKIDSMVEVTHNNSPSSDRPSNLDASSMPPSEHEGIRVQPERSAKKRKLVPDQGLHGDDARSKRQKGNTKPVKPVTALLPRNIKKAKGRVPKRT
ncbi:hypothetical protein K491DRAFT_677597 [Lophiostoma macrostomum CBS 122681]|uniref:Uncharacterized protein n=1 Tax=Lophiostoma macrostomum CBS 122681 TaxID=1314788 RepID=A0A6A6TAW7_9PLEO|nr:hypothetical protein K491DRAFT_677597 [Lophiostoma macrostomum CBS 122681]